MQRKYLDTRPIWQVLQVSTQRLDSEFPGGVNIIKLRGQYNKLEDHRNKTRIKQLQRYNIGIRQGSNIAAFNSAFYKKNYLSLDYTVMVLGIIDILDILLYLINEVVSALVKPTIILKKLYHQLSRTHKIQRQKTKDKKVKNSKHDKALDKD